MTDAPRRILVAEDELMLSQAMQFKLSKAGFDVTVAHDGDEAWKLAQASPFDLIVTDHFMPSLTGIEFCELLHASDVHRETPVLIITSMDREQCRESTKALPNVKAIVGKPFSPRKLMALVRETLSVAAGN